MQNEKKEGEKNKSHFQLKREEGAKETSAIAEIFRLAVNHSGRDGTRFREGIRKGGCAE